MHVQTQLLFPLSIFAAGWTARDRSIILLFPRVQKSKAQTGSTGKFNLNRICCILFCYSHIHISSDGHFVGKQITAEEFLWNDRILTLTFGCTSTRWTTSTQTPQILLFYCEYIGYVDSSSIATIGCSSIRRGGGLSPLLLGGGVRSLSLA